MRTTSSTGPRDSEILLADGTRLALRIRRHGAARRMTLRLAPADGAAVLVLPPGVSERAALAFARDRADWLASRVAALPPSVPFTENAILPLLGTDRRLVAAAPGQRGIQFDNETISIPGRPEHFARRVRDWLRRTARHEIESRAHPMAARLGKSIAAIRLGDAKTRWGSCSAKGALRFSWRLVLSPPAILTYVVAHEVAHLAQMNHSPAFWRLVETLAPDTRLPARAWLKRNGAALLRYGR
jgi:predicted metal-dependent hydrolase